MGSTNAPVLMLLAASISNTCLGMLIRTLTQVNVVMPDEGVAFSRPECGAELLKALWIDATGLALECQDELAQLVLRYQDVFALDETELGLLE